MSFNAQCAQCGAELTYEIRTTFLHCQYCGARFPVGHGDVKEVVGEAAEKIIPFGIGLERFTQRIPYYLQPDEFIPDDIATHSTVTKTECIHVPVYRVEMDYTANWSAYFYRPTFQRKSDDWHYASGTHSSIACAAVYAGEKLANSPDLPMRVATKMFALKQSIDPKPFHQVYLSGYGAESFKLLGHQEIVAEANNAIEEVIEEGVRSNQNSQDSKDWKWTSIKGEPKITKIYVPLFHAVIDYKGGQYNLWLDGSVGEIVMADELPEDPRKSNNMLSYGPVVVFFLMAMLACVHWGKASLVNNSFYFSFLVLHLFWCMYTITTYRGSVVNARLARVKESSWGEGDAGGWGNSAQSFKKFTPLKRPFIIRRGVNRVVTVVLYVVAVVVPLNKPLEENIWAKAWEVAKIFSSIVK